MKIRAAYDPHKRGLFYHLRAGLRFFFTGYRVLFRHPSLLALSLVPIGLTLIALVLIASSVVWMAGSLMGPGLNPFSADLRMLAQALVLLIALFVSYILYLPLARVLLAPFSEAISRRTRTVLGLKPERQTYGWARAMVEGIKMVLLQICLALFGLSLGLVFPPIAAPVGLTIAICFVSLDYLDIPLSVKGLRLRQKLGVIGRNKALATGFGAAGYLTLIIPVLNLLSLPVGVIGATILVDSLDRDAT
ncbi:MAG: EI24 domain-containing protein [Acidobacteriota bacterium]